MEMNDISSNSRDNGDSRRKESGDEQGGNNNKGVEESSENNNGLPRKQVQMIDPKDLKYQELKISCTPLWKEYHS